jgi:hypothetical protein
MILPVTNTEARDIIVALTAIMAGPKVGGSTKFDCTPGGGCPAGICDRSYPGGICVDISAGRERFEEKLKWNAER